MLSIEENEAGLQVHYRSYRIALLLLLLPPLMLYEYLPRLFGAGLDAGDYVALILGVALPLGVAYWLTEFASFTFSQREQRFRA